MRSHVYPCGKNACKDIYGNTDGSTDVPDIFSDGPSNSSSESMPDLDSESLDGGSGNDDYNNLLFNNEDYHPPEYYQAEAKSLDVSKLQQKQYSDNTERQLDETRGYWDQ